MHNESILDWVMQNVVHPATYNSGMRTPCLLIHEPELRLQWYWNRRRIRWCCQAYIKMDSINGVLGILISTVKRGFVIFLLNLTSLEIDVNMHVFRGALLSETPDRSQSNIEVSGHCARSLWSRFQLITPKTDVLPLKRRAYRSWVLYRRYELPLHDRRS